MSYSLLIYWRELTRLWLSSKVLLEALNQRDAVYSMTPEEIAGLVGDAYHKTDLYDAFCVFRKLLEAKFVPLCQPALQSDGKYLVNKIIFQ